MKIDLLYRSLFAVAFSAASISVAEPVAAVENAPAGAGASAETAPSTVPTPDASAGAISASSASPEAEGAPALAGGSVPAEPARAGAEPTTELASPVATPISDAEVEAATRALEAQVQATAAETADEFKLNIYGIVDFNYQVPLTRSIFSPEIASFSVGRLNLYAAADLGDDWRSLVEIRFMYLPNGNTPMQFDAERTDTIVGDNTDFQRPIRWGSIMIERAWLEHTFHPLLTVRLGQWLTPYGIWIVDHGSLVIIPVRRPYVVGESLFPERQTGIEAYGSFGVGPSLVGYHLTLSNGRGAVDTYQDYDHNKALGGRLYAQRDTSFGTFTVGISGYGGKYSDGTRHYSLVRPGEVDSVTTIATRYDELSLATDVRWQLDDFFLQGEAIVNDVVFAEGHRPRETSLTGESSGYLPNFRRFGVYGLTGYRTPWLGIMPFFGGEFYDQGLHVYLHQAYGLAMGINARPTPRVVLKAQYSHGWLPNDNFAPLNNLDLQAAWGF